MQCACAVSIFLSIQRASQVKPATPRWGGWEGLRWGRGEKPVDDLPQGTAAVGTHSACCSGESLVMHEQEIGRALPIDAGCERCHPRHRQLCLVVLLTCECTTAICLSLLV